ncbi:hypothetical protein [Bizionia echini]|uniref:hypothetical protein n=1 Tax=Bizionia echini TaxID=649333 RepID=UPI000B82E8C5|nr:hypothetical protein [Bizionia echini]
MKAIKISKQHLFVLCLFLLFFPIKTQFYNITFITFDAVLNSGALSDIYTYNYLGWLIGCQEILETQKVLGLQFDFFYSVVSNFFFILSIIASIILYKRIHTKQNFKYMDWILLAVFSFQLFETLERLLDFIAYPEYFLLETLSQWISLLKNFGVLMMAFVLFFKTCNPCMRKQIIMYALPASIASYILWFLILGPMILPIITR